MSITTAFLTAVAATTVPRIAEAQQDTKPQFPKQWWHRRNRLDIRPVLWSIRNRPQDWTINEYTLVHTPSKHEFWIASGVHFYGLYETNGCSCQSVRRSFSFIQKRQFRSALREWRASHDAGRIEEINKQFASHFVS